MTRRTKVGWIRKGMLAAGALLTVGCATEDGAGAPQGSLDGPDVALSWAAEPVFRLGGIDADDWAAFGEVTALAFDGAGRLHVLDGQRRQITVVSSRGDLEQTVAGPGDGPGELRFPSAMTVHPDGRIAVYDPGHGGFVVYAANGTFLYNVPVDLDGLPAPEPPLGVTDDGWIVASNHTPRREASSTRPVVAYSMEPDVPHEILWEAWNPPVPATEEPGPDLTGGLRIRLPPVVAFHPALRVAPLPGGTLAVVDSTSWTVRVLDRQGRVIRTLERPLDPSPVTEDVRAAERERRLVDALAEPPRFVVSTPEGATAGAGGDLVRRFVEARIVGMGFYEVIPAVARLGVDREGRLWVQRAGAGTGPIGPIDVLEPGGGYVGTIEARGVEFPDAFGPGGLLALRGEDGFGAPTVRVVRLTEDPSP